MKHYIFATTVLIFCCFGCYAQTAEQNHHYSAFYVEGPGTYLYSHAIGKKPVCYINNTEYVRENTDAGYMIELIKKSAGRFYVCIYSLGSQEGLAWYGWIVRHWRLHSLTVT